MDWLLIVIVLHVRQPPEVLAQEIHSSKFECDRAGMRIVDARPLHFYRCVDINNLAGQAA